MSARMLVQPAAENISRPFRCEPSATAREREGLSEGLAGADAPRELRPLESESEVRSPCRTLPALAFSSSSARTKALRLLAFEQASTKSIVDAPLLLLMTESQRPKLCCARARTPSGRPIVRHKDGLVLHAAARRRRRDTAASHCHRARVCEYGPQHRPRRRKGRAQYVVTLLSR